MEGECEICHKKFQNVGVHKRWKHSEALARKESVSISRDLARALSSEVNAPVHTRRLRTPLMNMVEPLHVSETWEDVGNNTPLTFRAMVDDDSYHRSLRSIPFGMKNRLTGKWPIILIIAGVAAVVVVMYALGMIPGGPKG